MRSRSIKILALVAVLGAGGCANMTATQQRTLSGGAIGAAGGAAIGAIAGNAGMGALIGAGAGAAGGYLYDAYENEKAAQYRKGYAAGQASKSN